MFLTKKELIAELDKIPDDAEIYIWGCDGPHYIQYGPVMGINASVYSIETPVNKPGEL